MSKTSKELLQEVHSMLAEYFLEELNMAREEGYYCYTYNSIF